jgi:tetratricopeptide (TPR) repeat protein
MTSSAGPTTLALVVVLLASATAGAAAPAAAGNAPPPGSAAAGADPLPGTPAAKAEAAKHRKQGEAAAAAGRFAEAERELSQALSLDPLDPVAKGELAQALFSLASASRKAQQYAQAADAFQRYTTLRPDEPAGYFGLADSLRQSGRPLEALAAYSTYVQKEDRASEQASVARAKERIAELQKVVRGGAGSPAPAAPAGPPPAAGARGGAPDAGYPVVVRKPGDEPPDAGAGAAPTAADVTTAKAKILDGDLAFATKDYRTALFAYQDAILADPGNAKARLKAGQAYSRLGYDDEAIGQWNYVLLLEPQNGEVHELIAQAQARNAERERQNVRTGPASGAGLPASGPPPPSGGTARTVPPQRSLPAPPAAVSPEASASAEARKHYAAGAALVRGAASSTGDQRAKMYQEGIAELDLAIAGKPGYAVALIARGSARLGLGQLQEAAQDYSAAHQADPALAAPLFGLAEAFRGQGQAQKAADLYREFARSTAPDAESGLKAYALKTAQTLAPR